MRGDQLSRQWRVLRQIEISRNGMTAAEIAELGGVSLRTAYRDLDDLQLAGFPLYSEQGESGNRWKLVEHYRSRIPPPFTMTELLSLHLSQDLFKVLQGTVFHESMLSLMGKVAASLPPETMAYLDRLRSTFHMGIRPYKNYVRYRELIGQVNKAAIDQKTIEIGYRGLHDEAAVVRRVDPYKIWFFEGSIYVIGWCHLKEGLRRFVLDRIQLLDLTDESFEVPADFNLDRFLRDSWKVMDDDLYTVRVQISPAWARYVGEKTWHESQKIQELFDGGIEIIFRVAGLEEIKQWVLSLGPEAYVVEPEELRWRISKALTDTLVHYGRRGRRRWQAKENLPLEQPEDSGRPALNLQIKSSD